MKWLIEERFIHLRMDDLKVEGEKRFRNYGLKPFLIYGEYCY